MNGGDQRPPVVVLSSIRWGFLWQRHQELASRFARAGYRTVFVETTGLANPHPASALSVLGRLGRAGGSRSTPETPDLAVYSPLCAPPTLRPFRYVNGRFFAPRIVRDLQRLVGTRPIVVAYPPTRTTLDIVRGLRPRLLLYDLADDYERFPGVPADIRETERALLDAADIVSCTSTPLLERARRVRHDAFLCGPGVDYGAFSRLQEDRREGFSTLCYFGDLSERRTDLPAIEALARGGYRVRIVGRVGRGARYLLRLPGVDYGGVVAHAELPAALRGVDAFVLPYRMNELTRSISPAKTYECLATGRPVVAAPLPAMIELAEHIYFARSAREYPRVVGALGHLETEEKIRARTRAARDASWEARFAEIEGAIWRRL